MFGGWNPARESELTQPRLGGAVFYFQRYPADPETTCTRLHLDLTYQSNWYDFSMIKCFAFCKNVSISKNE